MLFVYLCSGDISSTELASKYILASFDWQGRENRRKKITLKKEKQKYNWSKLVHTDNV